MTEYKTETIEHLGLVSSMIDELYHIFINFYSND
jgi:hypothetical protein